ncbi:MAG TPA: hypothetical protein VJH03_27180 [Blastocatellia bacterium]|nr:hypothetical protein [Blastocatellia bacterium]
MTRHTLYNGCTNVRAFGSVTNSASVVVSFFMADNSTRTLVLICRRGFCRVLDRVLLIEGFSGFQHGDLNLVGRSDIEARVGKGATEVFVIQADAWRAERLISLLRACPIRGEGREAFELYTLGE